MKNATNVALNAASEGWAEKLLRTQRRKLFEAFMQFRQGAAEETVLDIGLSPACSPGGLSAWNESANKSVVTACMLDLGSIDLHLPHAAGAFDWVYCGEVIEHATSLQQRRSLIAECFRVARRGVFLTTPNRRHPLEFNSALPFVHWLPPAWWQRVLTWTGRERWSGLVLLESQDLYALAAELPEAPAHDVGHKRVFGLKAHFFLMIQKNS